jgi:transposase
MPRAFPMEFRRDVVAGSAEAGADVPDREGLRDLRVVSAPLGEAEIRELKKRNRLLEQENEVLRRAAIYLGQGVNPK